MYDLIVKENAQICMVQGQLLLEEDMMFLCGKIFVFLKAKIMKIMQLHIMCFRRQQELLIVMPNYIIIYNAWGQ